MAVPKVDSLPVEEVKSLEQANGAAPPSNPDSGSKPAMPPPQVSQPTPPPAAPPATGSSNH